MIIFPAIDIKGGKCVRLIQGDFEQVTTYSEDPIAVAQRWKFEGAQWLHVVDLDGAKTGQLCLENRNVVRRIVEETGLPIQFGGGVRSVEAVAQMLEIGVKRCVIGTTAAGNAALARTILTEYGDHVAVGVDAREGKVATHGWQETSGESATDFVQRLADLGAKRFIFTDIARDGMLQGVNVKALAEVAAAVPQLPVIASGGVATLADLDALAQMRGEALAAANIEGVIIGKALYAGTVSLRDALQRVSE